MLRNIPLGVYYPGNSLIHRLQARTKFLIVSWIVGTFFVANQHQWHFAPYIALIVLASVGLIVAGLSLREIWRRLGFLVALTLFSALFSIFTPQGDQRVLYRLGPWVTSYALVDKMLSGLVVVNALIFLLFLFPLMKINVLKNRMKLLWAPLILLLFVLLISLWLASGFSPAEPFAIGPLVIVYGSVWALVTSLSVLFILYVFSLTLTMTTLPMALVEGLTILLAPLRRLKLPVDDFALMTLLALRFIPTLLDEAEQLIKAQTARGAALTRGTIRERLQSLAMFFLPLIHATLRRASDLSVALEARGYQADGRQTLLHETSFSWLDYTVMSTIILITLGSLLL